LRRPHETAVDGSTRRRVLRETLEATVEVLATSLPIDNPMGSSVVSCAQRKNRGRRRRRHRRRRDRVPRTRQEMSMKTFFVSV
jgi:hypothetical protein